MQELRKGVRTGETSKPKQFSFQRDSPKYPNNLTFVRTNSRFVFELTMIISVSRVFQSLTNALLVFCSLTLYFVEFVYITSLAKIAWPMGYQRTKTQGKRSQRKSVDRLSHTIFSYNFHSHFYPANLKPGVFYCQ